LQTVAPKLQFIHSAYGDDAKTVKITTKKRNITRNNMAWIMDVNVIVVSINFL